MKIKITKYLFVKLLYCVFLVHFFYSLSFSSDRDTLARIKQIEENTKAWNLYHDVLTRLKKEKNNSERLLCASEKKVLQAMDIISEDHEALIVYVKKLSSEGRLPGYVDVEEAKEYYPRQLLFEIRRLIPPKPSATASITFDGKNSILEVTIANFGKSMLEKNTILVSSIPSIRIPAKNIEMILPEERKSVKWEIKGKAVNHAITIKFQEKYGFNVYPIKLLNYN